MKLYVWESVLCDYTCGVVFALANSVEEAREQVFKEYVDPEDPWEHRSLENAMRDEPKVYSAPMCFRLWGGG